MIPKGDLRISYGRKAMIKYLFAVLGILSSTIAQALLKKTSALSFKDASYYIYFCFAGLFYVVSLGLYTLLLRHFPITKISPVMTLGTMMMIIIFGILMFNETITYKQMIGIVLGMAAIILISS